MTQPPPLRIMAIGAHPDDCELSCGGTAVLWARLGHRVVFLSVTNGQSGHHQLAGPALVSRRASETRAAAKLAGIESAIFPLPDGHLVPSLANRLMLIRAIREYGPDLILTNRPNDYHPDHRYTSQLVQDAAYSLTIPNIAPDVPALPHNPVILYWHDHFKKPIPFQPDVLINIDAAWDMKVRMAHQHTSQMYEFLPWLSGILDQIPSGEAARLKWLEHHLATDDDALLANDGYRELIDKRYGREAARHVAHIEAFEHCEYGAAFDKDAAQRLFSSL